MNNINFLEEGIDISPFLQVCLESEMTWNNIFVEGCESEFNAIITEDSQSLNDSLSDTKQKILQWIKDKINKLKIVMKDLITKIHARILNVDKFLKENPLKDIDVKVTVEIRTWMSPRMSYIRNSAKKDIKDVVTEKNIEDIKEIASSYKLENPYGSRFLLSNKMIKDEVYVKMYYNNIKEFKDIISMIKETTNENINTLNKMKKEIDNNADEKTISLYKARVSAIDTISSNSLTAATYLFSDTLKIIKTAKSLNKQ